MKFKEIKSKEDCYKFLLDYYQEKAKEIEGWKPKEPCDCTDLKPGKIIFTKDMIHCGSCGRKLVPSKHEKKKITLWRCVVWVDKEGGYVSAPSNPAYLTDWYLSKEECLKSCPYLGKALGWESKEIEVDE